TIAWTAIFLRLPKVTRRVRIDWVGAVLIGTAVSAIVLLTTWGGSTFDWVSWQTLLLASVAVISGITFTWWEGRSPEPLIPLRVFGSR
ncbi:hypothetical protein ABTD55_21650, partial [Acinetobacter baumannii]